MSLRELYQEMIVDHGRKPRNFGPLAGAATHSHVGYNPLCGDTLKLYLIAENGAVTAAGFEGSGCAISVASASLMTESIKGKSVQEIEQLIDTFHQLVTGKKPAANLGKLEVFAGVAEFPVRVKCATLAWHTLKAALHNDPDVASTE